MWIDRNVGTATVHTWYIARGVFALNNSRETPISLPWVRQVCLLWNPSVIEVLASNLECCVRYRVKWCRGVLSIYQYYKWIRNFLIPYCKIWPWNKSLCKEIYSWFVFIYINITENPYMRTLSKRMLCWKNNFDGATLVNNTMFIR